MKPVSRNITLFWLAINKEIKVSLYYAKKIKYEKRRIKKYKSIGQFKLLQGKLYF